jgi:hypothetical protein
MSTHQQPDEQAPDPGEPAPPAVEASSGRRTWIFAIIAAIVAGFGSWGVVEGVLLSYATAFQSHTQPYPTAEEIARIIRARIVSGTITFGATGAMVGLAFGLAGGASRRSIKRAALAGMAGLIVGGLAETGAAYGGLKFIYTKIDMQADDMLQTLLSHEALWAVVGLAGGLAFGLGIGGWRAWLKSAVGGLVGAAIATVVYEFLGALVFPTDGTHLPYANTAITRALAQVLIALGIAIGAVAMMNDGGKKRPADDGSEK